MVAAAAMFAAASCAQELENNQVPAGETVTFTAVADGVDTKAALNEETKCSEWEAGDAITVHNGTKGFEFTTEEAGSRATFSYTGNDFGGEKFLAVYPSGKSFDVAKKVVKAYIPTWQQAKAGTYNHDAAVAVAYSENDLFNFKNATALLKFTVNTDNVTHVVFHGNGSEAITGDVNITLGEEGVETVQCLETEFTEDKWNEETQQNDKVTVSKYGTWVECYAWDDNSLVDDPSDDTKYFTKGQTYYIAVAPQVFNDGVTAKIRIDSGEEIQVRTTTNEVETKINTILNLGELEYVAPVVETVETIYLKPEVWAADDAWFWAHFFGSGGEVDVKMTGPDANGMYQADVPAGMEKVLFCRMNPTWSEFSWDVTEGETLVEDHVWNQTGDLTVPLEGDDKFYYVITGWDTESTWMNYEDATYVAPEWTIAGTFNEWNTAAALVQSGDYFVAEDLVLYDAEFKILHNGDWLGHGAVAVDTWATFSGADNITVMDAAAGKTYDVYVNPAKNKFVVVANGMSVPAESADEEVVVGYWAVVGTMSGWGDYAKMTLDGDWHVAENVKLTTSDQFKFRADGNWDVERGAEVGSDGVIIVDGEETAVVQGGKNFSVAEDGFYSVYINKAATKAKVVKTADLPVESTPDQPCDWALAGTFNDWKDEPMVTTTKPDLFVIRNIELTDYAQLKVKLKAKDDNDGWATSYGVKSVNYINPNVWVPVQLGSTTNLSVVKADTYDIYFDLASVKIYVMKAGSDYTSAVEQTVSGEEPEQEEPEVTANVLYLTFDGVWKNGDERFAAYFYNGSGNNAWVSMTDSDSDGIFEVNIPAGYTFGDNVIFCRMNGSTTYNGWSNKWNQTADLTIPTDGKNLYTVNSWDGSDNSHWSTK